MRGQERIETAASVAVEPRGDGVAVDGEVIGDLSAGGRLTGGEQRERVEAALALGVEFGAEAGTEVAGGLGDDGERGVSQGAAASAQLI